jgi:DHA3 family macrolide efflux protein-like MFS transporter
MTPFLTVWVGQAFSLFGSELVNFALVWWLAETTGSATVLGLATMVALLPQVVLSPFAGALVDRWNRRVVMMVADGLIALAVVVLALLYRLGSTQVWHVYGLMFIRSALGIFHWAAMQASTPLMVPDRHLARVAGLNQTLYGAARIVTPPLGALLLAAMPMELILAVDVVTAMVAIGTLFLVSVPQPEGASTTRGATAVLADMRDGLRFVWGWRGLVIILGMSAVLNLLLNPAFALLPILVTRHFRGGATELAWMESAMGIGVLLGGLTLSVWGGFKRRVITAMLAGVIMGVGMLVVGLTPAESFLVGTGALFVVGLMNPIINGSLFAALQGTVPANMQGRVFALVISTSSAMSPLGMVLAGPVADALGVQVWFVAGGLATALLCAGMFFVPAVMHIEEKRTR